MKNLISNKWFWLVVAILLVVAVIYFKKVKKTKADKKSIEDKIEKKVKGKKDDSSEPEELQEDSNIAEETTEDTGIESLKEQIMACEEQKQFMRLPEHIDPCAELKSQLAELVLNNG